MASHNGFMSSTVLALALAASLLGWSSVRADTPAAEPDDDEPVVSVLDVGAKSAIAANLKAQRQTVVVTRFSVAPGASANRKGLSSRGCPTAARPAKPSADGAPAVVLDTQILDKISAQLSKRLAPKARVVAERSADKAPPNAMVVTGCITRFEAGDANKRMVGFNMGASRLAAHVRVNEKLRTGLKPVVEFDIFVKGGNMLPPLSPIGLATHVATMQRQTLAADATRLGNRTADAIENAFGVSDD